MRVIWRLMVMMGLTMCEPTIFQDDLEDLIFDVAVHILDKRGIDYANGFGNEGNVYFEVEKKQISMNYLVTTDECYSFNV